MTELERLECLLNIIKNIRDTTEDVRTHLQLLEVTNLIIDSINIIKTDQ